MSDSFSSTLIDIRNICAIRATLTAFACIELTISIRIIYDVKSFVLFYNVIVVMLMSF